MSIRAINWAFKQSVGHSSDKFVLIKLADNANDEGYCWPSLKYIVKHTELSKNTVITAIKRLETMGYLKVERQKLGNVDLSNRYYLQIPDSKGGSATIEPPPQSRGGVVQPLHSGSATTALGGSATTAPEPSEETISESKVPAPPARPSDKRTSERVRMSPLEQIESDRGQSADPDKAMSFLKQLRQGLDNSW